jgi:ATP-dependent DNA helicase RecG
MERLSYTNAEFWSGFSADETSVLDYKERLGKAGRLQEPVVAFANNRGGTIVVGVTEKRPRKIVGIQPGQVFEEHVQEAARETLPPLPIETDYVDVDGVTVGLLQVRPLEQGWAHTSDGRLIVRAGPTNRTLVGEELARFIRERGADPDEDTVVAGTSMEDLRAEALREYLRRTMDRPPTRALSRPAKDHGFVERDGRVRLAGLLLFGKEPQTKQRRFGIEFQRFAGTVAGGAELRNRRALTGNIPQLVHDADRLIYEEMRRDAVVRRLVREEVPEFPPIAIREALLNAVGHRDYSLTGASIEVRLYDDALEIQSPGALPGYVTLENIRDEQYSRNRRIMDAFYKLGLVEEAGQGIDRMFREMEDALLDPPEFQERGNNFIVRFGGRSVFAAEDRLWVNQFAQLPLSAHAKVALVYARRQSAVTNEELRSIRELSAADARSVLQELVANKLLQPVGRGRGTKYILGELARGARRKVNVGEQVEAIVAHAHRSGQIVNGDVRGLFGVDRVAARRLLESAVAQGRLTRVGVRAGTRYLPAD